MKSDARRTPERMSTARRLAFSAGMPGFVAAERIVTGILLYFYLPPANRGLTAQVPESTFLGVFTAYGLAMIVARGVDSVTAPVIGHASDRSRSRWGRRRTFMLVGFLPMVCLPAIAYWPPGPAGSLINVFSLTLLLCLYYVSSSMYMGPYGALVPEIARSDDERIALSRMMALVTLPMAGALMAWPRALDWGRAAGLDPAEAIRLVVVGLAGLAFVLCLIPFFAIDEQRFTASNPADLSLVEAIRATLRSRPFVIYLVAHITFSLSTSMIFPALPYIATVLLGRSEGFAFDLGAALGLTFGLGFAVIPRLTRRIGPRSTLTICFALFGLASALLGLIHPDAAGGPRDERNLVLAFAALAGMGLPMAAISLLPNVLIGQIIDQDARESGSNRSAIFLGVLRAFDKWMFGLSAALIAFLFARFGNSESEPLGVLLIGPIAGAVALASALLFTRFPQLGDD